MNIDRSDEEIRQCIADNYADDVDIIDTLTKQDRDFWMNIILRNSDNLFSNFIVDRQLAAKKEYWNIKDLSKIVLYYDIDCLKRNNSEDYLNSFLEKENILRYQKWQNRIKKFTIDFVRSNILSGSLEVGKNVFINERNFGDSLDDSVNAVKFIKLIDREKQMFGNFPLVIHPNIRQLVEKREQFDIIDEKNDKEMLQQHLKLTFEEDIKSGKTADELYNKFLEYGKKDSKGTYIYHIGQKTITKPKSIIKCIANILSRKLS